MAFEEQFLQEVKEWEVEIGRPATEDELGTIATDLEQRSAPVPTASIPELRQSPAFNRLAESIKSDVPALDQAKNVIFEEAIPFTGSIIGGIVGVTQGTVLLGRPDLGFAIGTGIGRASGRIVNESLQNLFTDQSKSFEDILKEAAIEGGLDALVAGTLNALGPTKRKVMDVVVDKASKEGGLGVMKALVNETKRVKGPARKTVLEKVARRVKKSSQGKVPKQVTKIVYNNPVETTTMGMERDFIDPKVLDDIVQTYPELLKSARAEFDKSVILALQQSNLDFDFSQLQREFTKELTDAGATLKLIGTKGKAKVARLDAPGRFPKGPVNGFLKNMEALSQKKGITDAQKAHMLKREIDQVMGSSRFVRSDGVLTSEAGPFKNLRKKINTPLRSNIGVYDANMSKFQGIIEAGDEIAAEKLNSTRALQLMLRLLDDANEALRVKIQRFSKLSPKAKQALDKGIFQASELIYSDLTDIGGFNVGARVGRVGERFRIFQKEIPEVGLGVARAGAAGAFPSQIGQRAGLADFTSGSLRSTLEDQ